MFIILLSMALVTKWMFLSFFGTSKIAIDPRFTGIKMQINDICLKEETKSIEGASEQNEEDQDWMNFKAPEYCKCVSNKIISYWSEKETLNQVAQLKKDDVPVYIEAQLKAENTKSLVDFCLSKAQKISTKKVTASASKN